MKPRGNSVWIGYDPRETAAFFVAQASIDRSNRYIPVHGLLLDELRARGLYVRATETRSGPSGNPIMWDTISGAPMSTEFAISRFLVPHLAGSGLALFVDCDVMARKNISAVFDAALRDPSKAVYCVKHEHTPASGVKMDGQAQTNYARKNWSSVMLFNCDHPANKALTVEMVNTLPGRDLHRFCWLNDEEIGALDPSWNWLVGHSSPEIDPAIVHFTEGGPWMAGYENVPYADEWRREFHRIVTRTSQGLTRQVA